MRVRKTKADRVKEKVEVSTGEVQEKGRNRGTRETEGELSMENRREEGEEEEG